LICDHLINGFCEIHKKKNPPEVVCRNCKDRIGGEHPCKEYFFDDEWCRFTVEGYTHFHARSACYCCGIADDRYLFHT